MSIHPQILPTEHTAVPTYQTFWHLAQTWDSKHWCGFNVQFHGLIERGPGSQSHLTSRRLWWTCLECLQDARLYWQSFRCDRLSWQQKPWRPPYVWWKIRTSNCRWIEEPSRFLTVFPSLWWWWALWACTAQENHTWWTAWLDRTMVRVVPDNSQLLELLVG